MRRRSCIPSGESAPAHYYTSSGYYGGGYYNELTQQIDEQWSGDLDEMHPSMFNHHHGRASAVDSAVAGIPLPPYAKFNNRVVFPGDLAAAQLPSYRVELPERSRPDRPQPSFDGRGTSCC